jgi:hypothetical protein
VQVLLEFRDGNGTVLDTYATKRVNTGGAFLSFSTTETAPSGTSLIRVRLKGFEMDGTQFTNVAVDALDLHVTNLPPDIVTNTGSSVDEGASDTITQSDLETTDPDESASDLTYTIDTDVTEGQLVNTGTSTQLHQGGTFTQQDVNDGFIEYQHDGTEPTSESFDFIVRDGQGGSASGTFSITINQVNDAPVISNISDRTIEEDDTVGPLSFTVDDEETNDLSTLTLSGTSNNTTLVPNPNISFTGPDASGNASVAVKPAPNESGTATITVTVDDGAGANNTTSEDFTLTVTTVPDLAVTDGSRSGLDVSGSVSPGDDDNMVGIFRLTARQPGASFDGVTVTNRNPGVSGISAARLYWSSDQTVDPGTDTQLGEVSTNASSAPSTIAFDGFSQSIPTSARYVILAIDVEAGASGNVQFELAQEDDLEVPGGEVATVNGTDQSSFSALPLSNGATALPVEMTRFDGTTAEEGVQLRWKTASEQNNAGFEVQRRVGAPEQAGAWTEVGFVEGVGTTSEAQTYRFTDTDLPYGADSVRYRLRQVDTDGSTTLTDPVTVVRSGPDQIELLGTAPNPARSRVTVRYGVPEALARKGGEVTLRLYDVLGRQVRTVETSAETGRQEARLDVSGLANGVYVLRLEADGRAVTRKLTVVR